MPITKPTRLLLALAFVVTLGSPSSAQLSPPNAAGVSYGHVHLVVKDVTLHEKLWVDHFNGVVVRKGPVTAIKFPHMLILLQQGDTAAGNEGTVIDHFGFHVRDLAKVLEAWRAAGYTVMREFTGPEGTKNAFLLGPDRVRFEAQENTSISAPAIPNHVHFMTPDNAALLDWYVSRFGLAPRPRGTIATTADAPNLNISFSKSQAALAGTKGRSVDHIGFEVKNLEAFVKKLEASGVTFEAKPRRDAASGLAVASFIDPSGVLVELTEGLDKY